MDWKTADLINDFIDELTGQDPNDRHLWIERTVDGEWAWADLNHSPTPPEFTYEKPSASEVRHTVQAWLKATSGLSSMTL